MRGTHARDDHACPAAEHEAEAEADAHVSGLRKTDKAEGGQAERDAKVADERAEEPHERRHDADHEAHGDRHRRVVDAKGGNARDRRNRKQDLREKACDIAKRGIGGGEAHPPEKRRRVSGGGIPDSANGVCGRCAYRKRKTLLTYKVWLQGSAGYETQNRAAKGGKEHLRNAEVLPQAQDPKGGDRKCDASCHHRPCTHRGVRDVGLMQVVRT